MPSPWRGWLGRAWHQPNVSYEIDPQYVGTAPLPKSEFRVIYQITGGDSPQTDTFTVTGGTVHYTKEGQFARYTRPNRTEMITTEGTKGAGLRHAGVGIAALGIAGESP